MLVAQPVNDADEAVAVANYRKSGDVNAVLRPPAYLSLSNGSARGA